jgi:hypothetical protein
MKYTEKEVPKKVWLVMYDIGGNFPVKCVCASKEIAEKKIVELRDEIVNYYKKELDQLKEWDDQERASLLISLYKDVIDSLSGDNYKEWEELPAVSLYIEECEVEE